MKMGHFVDSLQQPLVISLDIWRGIEDFLGQYIVFIRDAYLGGDKLYILCRKVNVGCQKKFSGSEEYAGRRRS